MSMISVIIPVYNVSRWLPQCLDSVLSQEHKELEVILVNDASTDASPDICHEYAARDGRVAVIDKAVNEGVESARSTGFSAARGEFVMYVDSDDWLDNTRVLSEMYSKAAETGADYVETGFRRVIDRHKWIMQKDARRVSGLIEQPELLEKYFVSFFGVNILSVNMCGKLYRKAALDSADIRPLSLCMGEDLAYNLQLFPHLRRIYIMEESGYNYRYGGMTSRYNPRVFDDFKRLYAFKMGYVDKYPFLSPDTLNVELKNVLKSEICRRIDLKGDGFAHIVAFLDRETASPVYARMLEVDNKSAFWQDPFVDAFARRDSGAMYRICRGIVRRQRPGAMLKKLGYRLLNIL